MNLINHSGDTVPHLVYVAKMGLGSEEFTKVGITSKTVEERYMGDLYQVLEYKSYQCPSEVIALGIEAGVLKTLYSDKIYPRYTFNGATECLKGKSYQLACTVTENLVNKYITENKKEEIMNELIKVEMTTNGQIAVSARELYKYLEIGTDFTNWCKRMFEYGFDENKDYVLAKNGENKVSKSNPVDYALTIDMAKEIAMLQRSDKGKQARQYFLECEKKLSKALPQTYKEALTALVEQIEYNEQVENERNEAIRTKAYISDKKTATAMGQVGGLTKSNNQMKETLGKSKHYSTIAHVKLKTGESFNPYYLKQYSINNNIEIKKISPMGYKTEVSSYSAESWLNVYGIDIKKFK